MIKIGGGIRYNDQMIPLDSKRRYAEGKIRTNKQTNKQKKDKVIFRALFRLEGKYFEKNNTSIRNYTPLELF